MAEPINITNRVRMNEILKHVKKSILAAVVLVILIILFAASTYTVGEAEQAVVSQFGIIKKIVVSPDNQFIDAKMDLMDGRSRLQDVAVVKAKGLQFRIPFITEVVKYDSRLFTYISTAEEVNTAEKKKYNITMYAQWRIANPGLFAITQKDLRKAGIYLDNLIFPAIVQNINKLPADDFISNKDALNEALEKGLDEVNRQVRNSGIVIQDIQVHRTILPPANLASTHDRMIANRQKVAQQLRSEGQEEYEKAISQADREARIIESEAIQEAEKLKGEADAAALEIYANAYSKDPDFYTYWRSLQALEKSIDEDTVIILDKEHPLWKDVLDWASPNQ